MYTSYFKMADLKIKVVSYTSEISELSMKYAIDPCEPDIFVEVTPEMIEYEKKLEPTLDDSKLWFFDSSAAFRSINESLRKYNAFVLHGASFAVDDCGVVFCAISGTGKSTHMFLWKQLLGDRLVYVNGDKPIVRFVDDVPYIYGSPWMGKEMLGANIKAPLTHICFIERSDVNSVEDVPENEISNRLSMQMARPLTPDGVISNMMYIEKLKQKCKFHLIKCNMEPSAAQTSYNAIFEKEK